MSKKKKKKKVQGFVKEDNRVFEHFETFPYSILVMYHNTFE